MYSVQVMNNKTKLKQNTEDLRILRTISKKPNISQRILSRKLGLSLGKLNYCLKELKKKNLIKIQNLKKNKKKSFDKNSKF